MITNTKRLIEAVRTTRKKPHSNDMNTGCEIIFTYLESQCDDSRDVSLDYKLSGGLAKLPCPSSPAKFITGISPISDSGQGSGVMFPGVST